MPCKVVGIARTAISLLLKAGRRFPLAHANRAVTRDRRECEERLPRRWYQRFPDNQVRL
jgi:hypothetical protein